MAVPLLDGPYEDDNDQEQDAGYNCSDHLLPEGEFSFVVASWYRIPSAGHYSSTL